MNFYLVDDDVTTRTMLKDIIEDSELGEVIGEAADGDHLDDDYLVLKQVDILLIDLLMPTKDGIETVSDIKASFPGKVIMISQVTSKNMISLAYEQGIEYYITKPLNKLEIVSVIKKVQEKIQLEHSMLNIHQLTSNISGRGENTNTSQLQKHLSSEKGFSQSALYILAQIGIIGENGYKDILDILQNIFLYEQEHTFQAGFPPLKEVYVAIMKEKLSEKELKEELNKETKSAEQRVRRAIDQSLSHLASLGLTDYLNPTFEKYAAKLFNFTLVRERMNEIKQEKPNQASNVQVSTKKFIQSLYFEVKHMDEEV